MKAVPYQVPRKIQVPDVSDARIARPTDVVMKITNTSTICGSDLHMYEGCTSVEGGKVLGHGWTKVVLQTGA